MAESWRLPESEAQRMAFSQYPRYPVLWFGDGHKAEIIRSIDLNGLDEDGLPTVKLLIRPSRDLVQRHNIGSHFLGVGNTVMVEYYKGYYKVLDDDPIFGVRMVLCDFHGGPTELTRALKSVEDNKYLEMENSNYRSAIARMFEENMALLEDNEKKAKKIRDVIQHYRFAYSGTAMTGAGGDGSA